ncbi:MAG: DUF5671 domain-containing protein, partial [Actinomycetota bacterium]
MIAQVLFAGFEFVLPLLIVGFLVVVVVALVSARREPDPAGSRPYAIYLVLVIFFASFTALFAITALASNVVRIPLSEQRTRCVTGPGFVSCSPSTSGSGSGGGSTQGGTAEYTAERLRTYDADRGHVSNAVLAGLIALAALAAMSFHVRRLRELVAEPEFNRAPGRRTYQVYLHAVSFTAVVILVFAGAAALYGLFRVIAPGYSAQLAARSTERNAGVAQLVSAGVLAIGSYLIFRYHWHRTRTLR